MYVCVKVDLTTCCAQHFCCVAKYDSKSEKLFSLKLDVLKTQVPTAAHVAEELS